MQLPNDVWLCVFDKCSPLTRLALGSTNVHLWRHYKSQWSVRHLPWRDVAGLRAAWGEMGGDSLTFTRIRGCRFVASCRCVMGIDDGMAQRLQAIDELCGMLWKDYKSCLAGIDNRGALNFKGRFNRYDLRPKVFPFDGTFRNKESPYCRGIETMLCQEDGGCDGYRLIWLEIAPTIKRGKRELDIVLKSCISIYQMRHH